LDTIGLAFGVGLMVYGTQMLSIVGLHRGSALDIPLSAVFLAIPVGGGLMAWYSLLHLAGLGQPGPRDPSPASASAETAA
jgi:TRAP-type C4-dicarboxylate transport system permease small subunit